MDKQVLWECADVKEEARDLKQRIHKLEADIEKLEKNIVTDSVACGKKGKKPLKTIKVTGIPNRLITRKRIALNSLGSRLAEKEADLLELLNQAEEYIEGIEKSELRIMFRFFFIDDLTYTQTAVRMNEMFPDRNIKYTDENVRKKIQRFFQNVPQCPVSK